MHPLDQFHVPICYLLAWEGGMAREAIASEVLDASF